MRGTLPPLILLAGLLAVPARAADPDVWSGKVTDPQVQAKAALLVDRKTGAVIYALNEHDELYPASLTKIMTCLLVLEAIDEGRRRTAAPPALRPGRF